MHSVVVQGFQDAAQLFDIRPRLTLRHGHVLDLVSPLQVFLLENFSQ